MTTYAHVPMQGFHLFSAFPEPLPQFSSILQSFNTQTWTCIVAFVVALDCGLVVAHFMYQLNTSMRANSACGFDLLDVMFFKTLFMIKVILYCVLSSLPDQWKKFHSTPIRFAPLSISQCTEFLHSQSRIKLQKHGWCLILKWQWKTSKFTYGKIKRNGM